MRACMVLVLVTGLASRRAAACSAPSCWPSVVVPVSGAEVPANLPAFWWRAGEGSVGPADAGAVRLLNLADGLEVALTQQLDGTAYTFAAGALDAGAQYRFTDGYVCGVDATVTVVASAPLPSTLGTLRLDPLQVGDLQVSTAAGSCSERITAAQVRAVLAPSTEATPWLSSFVFETLVDGQPWQASHSAGASPAPGGSWEGRGEDLFYRRCSTSSTVWVGLAAGPHQAVLRASLPGSAVHLETAPVTFVLSCDGDAGLPPAVGGDGGVSEVSHAGGDALERCGCGSGAGALSLVLVLMLRRRRVG